MKTVNVYVVYFNNDPAAYYPTKVEALKVFEEMKGANEVRKQNIIRPGNRNDICDLLNGSNYLFDSETIAKR